MRDTLVWWSEGRARNGAIVPLSYKGSKRSAPGDGAESAAKASKTGMMAMSTLEEYMGPASGVIPPAFLPRYPLELPRAFLKDIGNASIWPASAYGGNAARAALQPYQGFSNDIEMPMLMCGQRGQLQPYQRKALAYFIQSMQRPEALEVFVCDMAMGTGKTLLMTCLIGAVCHDGTFHPSNSLKEYRKLLGASDAEAGADFAQNKVVTICRKSLKEELTPDNMEPFMTVSMSASRYGNKWLYAFGKDSVAAETLKDKQVDNILERAADFKKYAQTTSQRRVLFAIIDEPQDVITDHPDKFMRLLNDLTALADANSLNVKLIFMSATLNVDPTWIDDLDLTRTSLEKLQKWITTKDPVTILKVARVPINNAPCVFYKHVDFYKQWNAFFDDFLKFQRLGSHEKAVVAFPEFDSVDLDQLFTSARTTEYVYLNDLEEFQACAAHTWSESTQDVQPFTRLLAKLREPSPVIAKFAGDGSSADSLILQLFGTPKSMRKDGIRLQGMPPHTLKYPEFFEDYTPPIQYLFIDRKATGVDIYNASRVYLCGEFSSPYVSQQLAARVIRFCSVLKTRSHPTYRSVEVIFVNALDSIDTGAVINGNVHPIRGSNPFDSIGKVVNLADQKPTDSLATPQDIVTRVCGKDMRLFTSGDRIRLSKESVEVLEFGWASWRQKFKCPAKDLLTAEQLGRLERMIDREGTRNSYIERTIPTGEWSLGHVLRIEVGLERVHITNLKPGSTDDMTRDLTHWTTLINEVRHGLGAAPSKPILRVNTSDHWFANFQPVWAGNNPLIAKDVQTLIRFVPINTPEAFSWFDCVRMYYSLSTISDKTRRVELYSKFARYLSSHSVKNASVSIPETLLIQVVDHLVPPAYDKFVAFSNAYEGFYATPETPGRAFQVSLRTDGDIIWITWSDSQVTKPWFGSKSTLPSPLTLLPVKKYGEKNNEFYIRYDDQTSKQQHTMSRVAVSEGGVACISLPPTGTVVDLQPNVHHSGVCDEESVEEKWKAMYPNRPLEYQRVVSLGTICACLAQASDFLDGRQGNLFKDISDEPLRVLQFTAEVAHVCKHLVAITDPVVYAIAAFADEFDLDIRMKTETMRMLSERRYRHPKVLILLLIHADKIVQRLFEIHADWLDKGLSANVADDSFADMCDAILEHLRGALDNNPPTFRNATLSGNADPQIMIWHAFARNRGWIMPRRDNNNTGINRQVRLDEVEMFLTYWYYYIRDDSHPLQGAQVVKLTLQNQWAQQQYDLFVRDVNQQNK